MADSIVVEDIKDHSAERTVITSIRITKNSRHWHMTVWNRGGQAGTLIVDAADGQVIVNKLIPLNRQRTREVG